MKIFSVEFLDMNGYKDVFCYADFLDTDHMNKQGALKATEAINEYKDIRTRIIGEDRMNRNERIALLLKELLNGIDAGDFMSSYMILQSHMEKTAFKKKSGKCGSFLKENVRKI